MLDLRIDRRSLIRSSMSAMLASLLPLSGNAGGHQPLPLIRKPVPSTGELLPVIGLGTNAFGVSAPEELARVREVLREMPELGGTVIDTAQAYGLSEQVIGRKLEALGTRDRWFIATKTPIRGDIPDPRAALDRSFTDLRVERIDLMQVHNLHETALQMPVFIEAREAGRLRYIGISTSLDAQYQELAAAMRRYPLDFIQVNYSIDDRSAADEILELAAERRMAVLVNMPFGGRRNAASIFARVANRELPDWAAEFDATSWAQVFLKYVVSHPAVTVAIPGTTRLANLLDNQAGGRGRLPDADMRRRIERYWDALPG
ncbi:MAG: aldo/keto reductase [Chromatiales bacterium]|nr:aldo/keto reductase [Chromatiales bacterium]